MENKNKIGIYDNCYNPFVFNAIPNNSTCLDVGCWTGNLGKELISIKNCIIDGMDKHEIALNKAQKRGYRKTYNIDLDNTSSYKNLLNREIKYDYIICADVLEHLKNPHEMLRFLKKKLSKKGVILISIPNIAFIQQRLFLLIGKFDYNPNGGIMDKTHLRFFTRKGIYETIKEADLVVDTFQGYALVKDKFFFLRPLANLWPELFALQFLIKIRNP